MRFASFALAATIASMLALGSSIAHAQPQAAAPSPADTARARARFAEGLRHYDAGDFARALDAFRAAYAARPHPSVHVNIANCYVRLGRPTQAVQSFTRYLTEMGDALEPVQRTEIEQALADAVASVAHLTIRATPEGQLVFVDGDQVGRAPIALPIDVDPGPHVVEMRSDGGATTTVRVTVARGETSTVRIGGSEQAATPTATALPPTTAGAAASSGTARSSRAPWRPPGMDSPAAEPTPPRRTSPEAEPPPTRPAGAPAAATESHPADRERTLFDRVPTVAWISGGVGVGLVVLGTVFGVAALSSESDFDAAAAAIESHDYETAEELDQLQADGRRAADSQSRNAILSDVSLGLGIAALATAVTVTVVAPRPAHEDRAADDGAHRRSRRTASRRAHASRAHVDVAPSTTGTTVSVVTTF